MHNYFRKYFLLLISLSLLQPIHAMENSFSWLLNYIYTTTKNYIPTFPCISFLTKYNFRKKNIEQNNVIHNNAQTCINIPQNIEQEKIKTPTNPPLDAVEDYNISPVIPPKKNPNEKRKTSYNNSPFRPHNKRINRNNIPDLDNSLSDPAINPTEIYPKNNLPNGLPENLGFSIEEKSSPRKSINKTCLDAVKNAQKYNFDREEDLDNIKKIIEQGANPNYPLDKCKQTLLMLAVKYHKKDLFYLLLTHGANINAQNIHGQTVLHTSVCRQLFYNFITIEDLLNNGADPNILDNDNQTPLFLAIDRNCEPAVIQLLINETNINQPNMHAATPLKQALHNIVSCGFFHKQNTLNVLYKSGASLINIDKEGNSIFHHLMGIDKKRLTKLIKSIIQNSTRANVETNEDQDMVALLSSQEANANSPTLYSVMHKMMLIQTVLQHSNKHGQTPRQFLHKYYDKQHIHNVENLFDENRPKKDFVEFLQSFPNSISEDNWSTIAYRHYLLENSNNTA